MITQPPPDMPGWTVVLLDCGSIDRNPTAALRRGAHLLNIDHHHDNTGFGTLNYLDENASCTAELVWRLLHDLQGELTPVIAQALYVGLITDTGRFMYSNTGPAAHLMAAELLQAGVDASALYRQVYEQQPLRRLTLLGIALGQVERFDDGQLTLAVLSAADLDRAQAKDSDSEGIIDQLRAIEGTRVAALAREDRDGEHRVSLRSTDEDVDVSEIARALRGGGHRRAAGFTSTLAPAELIAFLRQQIAAQLHGTTDRGYVAV
jgi:phosphoesterase RecJ-like protein